MSNEGITLLLVPGHLRRLGNELFYGHLPLRVYPTLLELSNNVCVMSKQIIITVPSVKGIETLTYFVIGVVFPLSLTFYYL